MRIHFIAIAGSAMHNLAIALHRNGHQITGSDDSIYEPSRSRLEKEGLLPQSLGWDPTRIDVSLDAIILGMHAKEDNPELLAAKALSINIYSYPEYLYESTKEKTRVVIGGSHGKTSITAMILHVLDYWDITTDFMVGAQLEGFDIMTKLTDDHDFVVLEGDEYLSSAIDRRPKFLLYKPNIALISGIAWDHVNVFPTEEDYIEQFRSFIDSITAGGILIYNQEDEILEELVLKSQNQIRKIPYKTHPFTISDGHTALDSDEGPIPLQIFGNHNVSNLSGALLVCSQMGVEPVMFYEAIPSFTGASNRLELFSDRPGKRIYLDFAHAPSKVQATTQAIREQFPNDLFLACLELHTFSSLDPSFIQTYANCLVQSDIAVVFIDDQARKAKGKDPLDEQTIRSAFAHQSLYVFYENEALFNWLSQQPASIVLMMSSGHFGGLELQRLVD
ncbi:MAG: Mur ligase family protein [Bacteroidota bacterium]|nr:Mur ligase family protein [Bacteroidota bacterium]